MCSIPLRRLPVLCTIWTAVAPEPVLAFRTNDPHASEATHPELSGRTPNHEPARHSLTHHRIQTALRKSGHPMPATRLGF